MELFLPVCLEHGCARVLVVLLVDVPDPDGLVARTRCQKVARPRKGRTLNLVLVALQCRRALKLARLPVPHSHRPVETTNERVFFSTHIFLWVPITIHAQLQLSYTVFDTPFGGDFYKYRAVARLSVALTFTKNLWKNL